MKNSLGGDEQGHAKCRGQVGGLYKVASSDWL